MDTNLPHCLSAALHSCHNLRLVVNRTTWIKMCLSTVPIAWALGVSGIASNFIIMIIPWPSVWKLQMATEQKLAVICILKLGVVCDPPPSPYLETIMPH